MQASQSGCSAVIRIPRESCKARHIRGNIEAKLAYPLFEYDVSLYETNDAGSLFLADSQPLYRAGGFDFDVPCAGDWVAIVQDHWGGHWSAYASPVFAATELSTTVTLTPATQTQLQKLDELPADHAGRASVHGVFHLDGLDWAAACPAHVSEQIGLLREGAWSAVFSLVDPQGRFGFQDLKPGRYMLQDAYFAHGAAYVASFRVDGKEADDRVIGHVKRQVYPGCCHVRSAGAEKTRLQTGVERLVVRGRNRGQLGELCTNRLNQFRREQIPARLPSDQHEGLWLHG